MFYRYVTVEIEFELDFPDYSFAKKNAYPEKKRFNTTFRQNYRPSDTCARYIKATYLNLG